jgi:hypothetical protein
VVDATFISVATPYGASVLEPVVPVPARFSVSDVMEIVTVAPAAEIIVTTEPIGKATDEFAGTVTVEVDVTYTCLP